MRVAREPERSLLFRLLDLFLAGPAGLPVELREHRELRVVPHLGHRLDVRADLLADQVREVLDALHVARGNPHRDRHGVDGVGLRLVDAAEFEQLQGVEVLRHPTDVGQGDQRADVTAMAVPHHVCGGGGGVGEVAVAQEHLPEFSELVLGGVGSHFELQDELRALVVVDVGTADPGERECFAGDLNHLHRRQCRIGQEEQTHSAAALPKRTLATVELLRVQALGRVLQYGFGHDAPFIAALINRASPLGQM